MDFSSLARPAKVLSKAHRIPSVRIQLPFGVPLNEALLPVKSPVSVVEPVSVVVPVASKFLVLNPEVQFNPVKVADAAVKAPDSTALTAFNAPVKFPVVPITGPD